MYKRQDQMVLLIDTIEQMSPEIYEHYRALQDMFRIRLKAMLAGENPGPHEQLAYIKMCIRDSCWTICPSRTQSVSCWGER